MAAKVSKVEIKMGKRTVSLSLEEVKELRDALNELFGETVIEKQIIRDREYIDWPWWRRPWITLEGSGTGSLRTSDSTSDLSWAVDKSSDTLTISL